MTVEIDETTGLPVLPDGEWWQVLPPVEWNLIIFGSSKPPRVAWAYTKPAGTWSEWASSPRPERNYEDREHRDVERDVTKDVTRKTWLGTRTEQVTERVTVREFRTRTKSNIGHRGIVDLPRPFDQADILSGATEVYEREMKRRAQDAFYGDYPPKRLGAVE